MNQIIAAFVFFIVVGVCLFILSRMWYLHLTNLADRHDISKRLKIATIQYVLIVIPIIGFLCLGSLTLSFHLFHIDVLLIAILFVVSAAPTFIWWFKNWPVLKKLGYGRQN